MAGGSCCSTINDDVVFVQDGNLCSFELWGEVGGEVGAKTHGLMVENDKIVEDDVTNGGVNNVWRKDVS